MQADVSYELYKLFYHVAKNLSFTIGAQELYLSQSAVSQGIKQLELKLGCPLFYRGTKQVRMTEDGKMLFDYVKKAVTLINAGERMLLERQNLESGEIRLASTDTICKYFLLPRIKTFRVLHPGIKITIVNRTSPDCLRLLQNGDVDIAVVNIPQNLPENVFRLEQQIAVRDCFILSKEIWEGKHIPNTLAEISKLPLIVLDRQTVTRFYFDKLMTDNGINVVPEIEMGSVDLLIETAKAGLGVGFAPDFCLKGFEGLIKAELDKEPLTHMLGAVSLERLPKSKTVATFLDELRL